MDLQVPLLIIDLRGVSIMSALFENRRVTHLRDTDTIWSKYVLDKDLRKRWNHMFQIKLFRVKLLKLVLHVILKCCRGFYVNVC